MFTIFSQQPPATRVLTHPLRFQRTQDDAGGLPPLPRLDRHRLCLDRTLEAPLQTALGRQPLGLRYLRLGEGWWMVGKVMVIHDSWWLMMVHDGSWWFMMVHDG